MATYRYEYRGKKNGKTGNWWVVICPSGRIANEYYHTTERSAKRHCENLNVFFGDKTK